MYIHDMDTPQEEKKLSLKSMVLALMTGSVWGVTLTATVAGALIYASDIPILENHDLYEQSYEEVDIVNQSNDPLTNMSIRWMQETQKEGFFLSDPEPLTKVGPFGHPDIYVDVGENGLEADFTEMRSVMHYLATQTDKTQYELAEQAVQFSNQLSNAYYIYDSENPDTSEGRFETLQEVLEQGQNDCDGLALLTQQLLLDAGFPPDEIYFAIINNNDFGQPGHALMAWKPNNSDDPLLIDSTNVFEKPIYMSDVEGYYLHSLRSPDKIYRVSYDLSFSRIFNHFANGYTEDYTHSTQQTSNPDIQKLNEMIERYDNAERPPVERIFAESIPLDLMITDGDTLQDVIGRARTMSEYMGRGQQSEPYDYNRTVGLAEIATYNGISIFDHFSTQGSENVLNTGFNNASNVMTDEKIVLITRQLMIEAGIPADDIYIAQLSTRQPQNGRDGLAIVLKSDGGPDMIFSPSQKLGNAEYDTTSHTSRLDNLMYFTIDYMTNGTEAIQTQQRLSPSKIMSSMTFDFS